MADQTSFAVTQAHQAALRAQRIAVALSELEDIKEHLAGAGIDLLDYADEIAANSETNHADASAYKIFINDVITGLVTHMVSGSATGGNSYWNWMQTIRKIG